MECRLCVERLPLGFTTADLKDMFAAYGTVVSARLVKDSNGVFLSYGFVEMQSMEDATKAVQALDGSERLGYRIKVWQGNGRSATHVA